MTDIFTRCIEVVLDHEGGFQKNPNDRGNWVGGYKTGRLVGTKYGIAALYFPNEDIPNLTIDRAKELYFEYFWQRMKLEGICREAAVLEIFDFGVNANRWRSIRMAQRLVNVKPDGYCGPVTRSAINNYDGDFVADFKQLRKIYYHEAAQRPGNHVFLNGWLRRVDKTHF